MNMIYLKCVTDLRRKAFAILVAPYHLGYDQFKEIMESKAREAGVVHPLAVFEKRLRVGAYGSISFSPCPALVCKDDWNKMSALSHEMEDCGMEIPPVFLVDSTKYTVPNCSE